MKSKFIICPICGNLYESLNNGDNTPTCCGSPMKELKPNTTDAATEKHVPVIEVNNNIATIKVGETLHPMTIEHYISWIYLETNKGIKRVSLKPDMEPIAKFSLLEDEIVIAAYSYCNLHSLWVKEN